MTKHILSLREKLEVVYMFMSRSAKLLVRFKISFIFSVIAMFVTIAIFYFIGGIFGESANAVVIRYGGNYFSYVLVGLALSQYVLVAINSYLMTIRTAYWGNWLEMILSSPMRLRTFFISVMSWSYIYATINIILYFIIGIWIFGANIPFPSEWSVLVIILLLTIISISGIGLIAASMFLLAGAKGEIEPVSWTITTFSALLTGAYFPVQALPPFIQSISYVLPQTYALEGIRLVLLGKGSIYEPAIQQIIVILIIFSLILLPLGMKIFKLGIKKAEKDGTLARWV